MTVAYEGWLSFAGVELVNNARAQAYASSLGVRCSCGGLAASLGDDGYIDPVGDEAPWIDRAAPESKDFWGLVGLELTGADASTAQRQWTELLGDGGVGGAERRGSREIEVKALALAADDQALNFGLAWLSAALRGSACRTACTGDELCVYTACPQPPDTRHSVDCDQPAPAPVGVQDSEWNPLAAGDGLLRSLFEVSRVEGPRVEERRRLSGGVSAVVSFTLKAGVPHWYHLPTPVARIDLRDLPDDVYADMIPAHDPMASLRDCTEEEPQDCLSESPYCVLPPFPAEPVLSLRDPCFPTSVFPASRMVFTVDAGTNPGWSEKAGVLRIHSGSLPMHRFTVRFYDNPLARWCQPEELNPCLACSEITLPYLPRSSTLTIDARTRRAELECPRQGAMPAEHALYGPGGEPFDWPIFDCAAGMCVEILAESNGLARDVTVQVDLVTREDVA